MASNKLDHIRGVLRSKEIYARAANYLQTLNWHTDGEISLSLSLSLSRTHTHSHTHYLSLVQGVLRSKEIYARAANYLQTLNWHTDREIMKKIYPINCIVWLDDAGSSYFSASLLSSLELSDAQSL